MNQLFKKENLQKNENIIFHFHQNRHVEATENEIFKFRICFFELHFKAFMK